MTYWLWHIIIPAILGFIAGVYVASHRRTKRLRTEAKEDQERLRRIEQAEHRFRRRS